MKLALDPGSMRKVYVWGLSDKLFNRDVDLTGLFFLNCTFSLVIWLSNEFAHFGQPI